MALSYRENPPDSERCTATVGEMRPHTPVRWPEPGYYTVVPARCLGWVRHDRFGSTGLCQQHYVAKAQGKPVHEFVEVSA